MHVPGPGRQRPTSRPPSWPPATSPGPRAVSYTAQRDERKRPGRRGRWHVLEDGRPFQIRNAKRKKDPPITLRRIFVHSSARASGAAASRAKKLARARGDPGRLARGLGGRFYPDEKTVTERLQQIAAARKAGPYLRYTVSTTPDGGAAGSEQAWPGRPGEADRWDSAGSGGPGKPALTWWSGQDAIAAEAATDGWYALLTNLDTQVSAAEVLLRTKVRKPWNAATATSKARSRLPRCC